MSDAELARTINLAGFLVFTTLLVLGAASTLNRARRYLRAGTPFPRLLVRDLVWYGGMGFVLVAILLIRGLGLAEQAAESVVWALISSGVACFAVGVYAWYEVAIIERVDEDERGGKGPS